jgi:hypothetical protein
MSAWSTPVAREIWMPLPVEMPAPVSEHALGARE